MLVCGGSFGACIEQDGCTDRAGNGYCGKKPPIDGSKACCVKFAGISVLQMREDVPYVKYGNR